MAIIATIKKEPAQSLDYTPSGAAVLAGQIVAVGTGVAAIATHDIADGVLGSVYTGQGVFSVTGTKTTTDLAPGSELGYDDSADTVSAFGEGDHTAYLGRMTPSSASVTSGTGTIEFVHDYACKVSDSTGTAVANQADSTAADVAGIVSDFNDLLAAMIAAGHMASS